MTPYHDERAAELRDLFFLGAVEYLQALNENGLRLEASPQDGEALREVRRVVHTLKGDSAIAGLRDISELAHELEDVLTPELAQANGRGLAELVLAAADMFDAIVTAHRAEVEAPSGDPLRSLIWKLAQHARPDLSAFPAPVQPQFAWSEYERAAIADAQQRGENVFHIAIRISSDCPMPAACRELIRKMLHEMGSVLAIHPAEETETLSIEAALACQHEEDWILERCRIPNLVSDALVVPVVKDPAAGNTTEQGGPPRRLSTLRVDVAKLDEAMDLAGELILSRSMLQQAITEFSRRFPKDPLRGKLAEALAFQTQVLNGLQRSLLEIRMVRVEQLFRRFPRLVRDLEKSCRKPVQLAVSGGETGLDKMILDAMAEPLAHLVRNAVDHGIESPAERAAAGKAKEGTVRLQARHEGGQAVIEVSDDGRGIDRDRVLARALDLGLVTETEAARLSDSEVLKFIFEPGFSTATAVTEISGRGVGMDAVKAAVERLKGSVEVQSEPGRGTRVLLRLPLTLAITRAMLLQCGGRLYAVPVDNLQDVLRLTAENRETVGGREVLRLRDQLIPLVHLPDAHGNGRSFAMVVSVAGRKHALVADKVLGEEQLVLKTLDGQHAASEMVSGAAVLGDGRVVLVLNVASVVERGMAKLPAPARPANSQGMEASA
ncbi:MAG TPA: chemotaxis protein CheA [Terriglobales bacterium]|nr:chemotaxis protein CheA [Terriglobales bacterium]